MRILMAILALGFVPAAHAETDLERGLRGALTGCETWILDPASWNKGPAPFVAKVGLGAKMGLVDRAEEVNLPPPALRDANHYWRINSTATSGYVLVVSDRLPMCHITGGGAADLQPAAETVLSSADFNARWEKRESVTAKGMVSTVYRNRTDPLLSIRISRADKPGQRTDHVQLIATAVYRVEPKR